MDDESTQPKNVLLRAIGLRFRFLFAIGMLATLITGWPWLQTCWDRWVVGGIVGRESYSVSADSEFFCPMDPGIISAWPAICPICNMDLITRKKLDAVLLPEGVLARMQLSPYRVQLAGIRSQQVQSSEPEQSTILVPTSAIVHRDSGAIVYVETMTGMYDAIPVILGTRQGDLCAIDSGLNSDQRVVTVGAFLIDAETRLNPSVATQYFGANQHLATSSAPTLAKLPTAVVAAVLSDAEQQLIATQKLCPVTEEPLGSMGQPVFITVDGRKVALCCKGCERRFVAEKKTFFEILDRAVAPQATGPTLP